MSLLLVVNNFLFFIHLMCSSTQLILFGCARALRHKSSIMPLLVLSGNKNIPHCFFPKSGFDNCPIFEGIENSFLSSLLMISLNRFWTPAEFASATTRSFLILVNPEFPFIFSKLDRIDVYPPCASIVRYLIVRFRTPTKLDISILSFPPSAKMVFSVYSICPFCVTGTGNLHCGHVSSIHIENY